MAAAKRVRVAALADLHFSMTYQGVLQPLFAQMAAQADVLVLCGDLTDYGTAEEAQLFAKELAAAGKVPVVAVLGNHDFETGHQKEVHEILANAGVRMLDGDACEVQGVGFAGVKGFGGGFDRYMLSMFGEQGIKDFVQEAVDEALKLDRALAHLENSRKTFLRLLDKVRSFDDEAAQALIANRNYQALDQMVLDHLMGPA